VTGGKGGGKEGKKGEKKGGPTGSPNHGNGFEHTWSICRKERGRAMLGKKKKKNKCFDLSHGVITKKRN